MHEGQRQVNTIDLKWSMQWCLFQYHLKRIESFCAIEGIPMWKIRHHTGAQSDIVLNHVMPSGLSHPSKLDLLGMFSIFISISRIFLTEIPLSKQRRPR